MAALARMKRLREAMQADIDALPDLPKPAEPEPEQQPDAEPETSIDASSQSEIQSRFPIQYGAPLQESNSDSDDSEAGCRIEMTQMMGDIRVAELDDSDDDSSLASKAEGAPSVIFTSAPGGLDKMQRGQLTPIGLSFCPILPISKFPYKYIGKKFSEDVADAFFNGGKFWDRKWDLFYIWPIDTSGKPVILISYHQFAELCAQIGAKFTNLYIDAREQYYRDISLVIESFPAAARYRPRFLGTSTTRERYNKLCGSTPITQFHLPNEMASHDPTDAEAKAFREMVEGMVDLNRSKKNAKKSQGKEMRYLAQQNIGKELKRAQRYLGLLPKRDKSATEKQAIPPIDPSIPAPYPFEKAPIIICVDTELYERNHAMITEVGVATLDTRGLVGLPPDEGGKNWFHKIRARHFRTSEYKHYINTEFVRGCPDKFEFGDSEFVALKDAKHVVESCFKEPFSRNQTNADIPASWISPAGPVMEIPEDRAIILLGHNPSSDIKALQMLGYDPLKNQQLLEVLDTAQLYRAFKQESNTRAVMNILYDFGLTGWNLHNAGNDAVYTMWIFLGTTIRQAMSRGSKETAQERKEAANLELGRRIQETVDAVMGEREGWISTGDD